MAYTVDILNAKKVIDNGLLSKIQIGGKVYEVKDLIARENIGTLSAGLDKIAGDLAALSYVETTGQFADDVAIKNYVAPDPMGYVVTASDFVSVDEANQFVATNGHLFQSENPVKTPQGRNFRPHRLMCRSMCRSLPRMLRQQVRSHPQLCRSRYNILGHKRKCPPTKTL